MKTYLSYASADHETAAELKRHLQLVNDVVFFDPHELRAGLNVAVTSNTLLHRANVAVCLLSADYFDEKSAEFKRIAQLTKVTTLLPFYVHLQSILLCDVDELKKADVYPSKKKALITGKNMQLPDDAMRELAAIFSNRFGSSYKQLSKADILKLMLIEI